MKVVLYIQYIDKFVIELHMDSRKLAIMESKKSKGKIDRQNVTCQEKSDQRIKLKIFQIYSKNRVPFSDSFFLNDYVFTDALKISWDCGLIFLQSTRIRVYKFCEKIFSLCFQNMSYNLKIFFIIVYFLNIRL